MPITSYKVVDHSYHRNEERLRIEVTDDRGHTQVIGPFRMPKGFDVPTRVAQAVKRRDDGLKRVDIEELIASGDPLGAYKDATDKDILVYLIRSIIKEQDGDEKTSKLQRCKDFLLLKGWNKTQVKANLDIEDRKVDRLYFEMSKL